MGGAIIKLTRVLSCTCATKEASVLGVWSIFVFIIKHIFPCSFENKHMRFLTCVYGISTRNVHAHNHGVR